VGEYDQSTLYPSMKMSQWSLLICTINEKQKKNAGDDEGITFFSLIGKTWFCFWRHDSKSETIREEKGYKRG
jgi:hypothetical protein